MLARFYYKSGIKMKLKSFITFRELIDMSQHLSASDVAPVYDLVAVMIHRGQSASSGHYIAKIIDPVTQKMTN